MNNFDNMTEEEFLAQYNPDNYERPSVTVDMLIFAMNKHQNLEILLIERGVHPFKGKWALPGGFVGIGESLDEAAARELKDETNLDGIYLEQLYTFGEVNRDVRTRVISVSYIALVPAKMLNYKAGDDASDACLFEVKQKNGTYTLISKDRKLELKEEDLAFDHAKIIRTGLERLKGKVNYTDIALELLENKEKFSIYELQLIFEALTGEEMDVANFRRSFMKKYLDSARVEKLEEKCYSYSKKPSSYYRLIK